LRPDVKQGWLMQNIPEPTEGTEMLGTDTIEQVVPSDHDKRGRRDRPLRQVDKPSEHDHGSANDPYDPGKEKLEIEVEVPAEAHQRELDEYKPKAAGQKKKAQLAARFAIGLQRSSGAGGIGG
jgi:hypothetical protein